MSPGSALLCPVTQLQLVLVEVTSLNIGHGRQSLLPVTDLYVSLVQAAGRAGVGVKIEIRLYVQHVCINIIIQ